MKLLLLTILILVFVTVATALNEAGQHSSPRPTLSTFNSNEEYPSLKNDNLKNHNVASIRNNYEQQQQGQSSEKSQLLPEVTFKSGGSDGDYTYNPPEYQQMFSQNSEPEIDSSNSQARYNDGGGYSGGTNYGWTATNPGYNGGTIICTACSYYDVVNSQRCCGYGFRQCCNVGIYPIPTAYNSWSSTNYPIGGGYTGYSSSGQEKPGSCYYSNTGYQGGGSRSLFNQNAGYYYTRRSDDDNEGLHSVKREAALGGSGSNYQTYGTPYNSGGYSGGGSYVSGRFPSSGWGHSGSGHQHVGYGIPTSTYRPPIYSPSCRRDYDCPGIQKCCSAVCSNPTITVG